MPDTIQIGPRPASLDGCFQTWSEHDSSSVIRSDMDIGGYTKVRRRTTEAALQVDASVTLDAALYADFQTWFRVNSGAGVFPTRVKRPDGAEIVMRFTQPPVIEWPEANKYAFRATVALEQLPAWRYLT
jgi:hypothetical protein